MADEITVGGITVPITHPDKVLFPADGITKADLARYYADVAGQMLPWLRDRPITMVRYPAGWQALRRGPAGRTVGTRSAGRRTRPDQLRPDHRRPGPACPRGPEPAGGLR